MKVVIYGSRDVHIPITTIQNDLDGYFGLRLSDITEVVCGMAKGADDSGLAFAKHLRYPVKLYPADWDQHGARAGFIRNLQMAEYADVGLGYWRNWSRGTAHMTTCLVSLQKRVAVVTL